MPLSSLAGATITPGPLDSVIESAVWDGGRPRPESQTALSITSEPSGIPPLDMGLSGHRRQTWHHWGMDAVLPYLLAVVPTLGVAALFWVVMKNVLEGDRRERIAQAKWEAERELERGSN
jgi:hypothetical protein